MSLDARYILENEKETKADWLTEQIERVERQKQVYEEIAERADTKVQQSETEEQVTEWTDMVVQNLAKADALTTIITRYKEELLELENVK